MLAVMTSAGCGPDDNNQPPIEEPPNNTANNDTNNSTNNDTTATNNVIDNPDQECPQIEVFTDESFAVQREFYPSSKPTVLSCADDIGEIASNGAYIARVQYSAPTRAVITVAPIAAADQGRPPRPVLEIRGAACETGEVAVCASASTHNMEFEADIPYYLILNGLLESGGVSLTVDATSAVCTAGESSCEDGTFSICNAEGTGFETVACSDGCHEGRCAGDVCEAPIVVTPEPGGAPVLIEGNRATLTAQWDANNGAGCELYEGQGPTATPGPELFVRVPGVTAGQRVLVDAEASELSYGFFVIDSCTATTCAAGFAFDANGLNRADYTATADGDVLFVVEALGTETRRDFTLEVSIVE